MRALLLLLLAGCYSPTVADGQYTCPDSILPVGGSPAIACRVCIKQSESANNTGPACVTCSMAIACELLCQFKDMACLDACHSGLTAQGLTDIEAVETCIRNTCTTTCIDSNLPACKNCPTMSVHAGGPCNAMYNTCVQELSLRKFVGKAGAGTDVEVSLASFTCSDPRAGSFSVAE